MCSIIYFCTASFVGCLRQLRTDFVWRGPETGIAANQTWELNLWL